jgi:16S rRNA (guanine527-N7)-methyltransferase
MPGEHEELRTGLCAAGVDTPLADRLAAYGALLLAANRTVNLTGAKDAAALVPHLLDALTLAGDVSGRLVDVGSGGGLPGIPLAIATGARVLLVEPIAKKAAFLQKTLERLGLDGSAIAERAEIAARDDRYRAQFDYATARAVSGASTVAELTVPFLRIGGRVMMQRATMTDDERHALDDAALVLGAPVIEDRRLAGERRIIVLAKAAPTGERFPRRNGVPEKRPLGTQNVPR